MDVKHILNSKTITVEEYNQKLLEGYFSIPYFQRNFVWETKKVCNLVDSMLKGYKLGRLTVWKTEESVLSQKDILKVPVNTLHLSNNNYVVDGCQRTTSLFGLINGIKLEKFDFKNFYFAFDEYSDIDKFKDIEVKYVGLIPKKLVKEIKPVYISRVLTKHNEGSTEFEKYIQEFSSDYGIDNVLKVSRVFNDIIDKFYNYSMAYTECSNTNIDEIRELFTIINQEGNINNNTFLVYNSE